MTTKANVSCLQVVYVTVVLPYISLGVLLVRFLTLPGSQEGIYYFFRPQFGVLQDLRVSLGRLMTMTHKRKAEVRGGADAMCLLRRRQTSAHTALGMGRGSRAGLLL